jgi:coenzyme F420-reducing hydrogenase alpha subunit
MNGRQGGRAHHEAVRPGGTNTPVERRRRDQTGADTKHDRNEVAFRVVAVLECVVPSVEHLQDWRPNTHGEQKCGQKPAYAHEANDSTAKDKWVDR